MTEDLLIKNHMNTAGALLQHLFDKERAADADVGAGLDRAMRAGAMFVMRTTFAPSTGLLQLDIRLQPPVGESMEMLTVELKKRGQE